MNLRLAHPPTPEFAAKHAETAVKVVKDAEGTILDYAPDSLQVIDRIIIQFRNDGLQAADTAEAIFVFGCYAGEVFVRNLAAVWADPKRILPKSKLKHFPYMVIQMPGGHVLSPISRAFRELGVESSETLALLYESAAKV